MRTRLIFVSFLATAALGITLQVPVDGGSAAESVSPASERAAPSRLDLSAWSDAPPGRAVPLVFIHHSCGGQLLAPAGSESEWEKCIYAAHPNGGGLRPLLEAQGYRVHEASYGSEVGDRTDLFDWLPKFRDKMEKVLRIERNDTWLPEGGTNEIVVFKSCYTQSELEVGPDGPGRPTGPTLNVANAKATLTALLPHFQSQPGALFVYLTSPPLAPGVEPVRLWRWLARKALGHPDERTRRQTQGRLARELSSWARSPDGWLRDYPLSNVVVFDYADVLTGAGASNLSRFPTGGGLDSHPAAPGNALAAQAFVPFLNRALRRHAAGRTPAMPPSAPPAVPSPI